LEGFPDLVTALNEGAHIAWEIRDTGFDIVVSGQFFARKAVCDRTFGVGVDVHAVARFKCVEG
jgi:hypothetical protein